jgi:ankyrin repeat protein
VRVDWEQAVVSGDVSRLRALLDSGVDIDARDRYKQTALMLAAHRGHEPAVALLIERGAALDNTAKYGLSALMLAVVAGHQDIARRLADAGANLRIQGTGAPGFSGKTAYDLAVEREFTALISHLVIREEP